MRVLHLIDTASPQACSTTFAMIGDAFGRLGSIEQKIALLGGDNLRDAALNANLNETTAVGVIGGKAVAGWWRVPRVLNAAGWNQPDLIHAWSIGALTLAAMRYRQVPRALTLTVLPTKKQVRWLRALTRDATSRTVLFPISSTIRRSLLQGGVPESAVHVLRPAIDMARIERTRQSVREQWGIPHEDDKTTRVVALLSDPPTASDGEYALNVLHTYALTSDPPPLRIVMHPDQRNIEACHRVLRDVQRESMLILDRRVETPWQILTGCDLALAIGHDGPVEVNMPSGRVMRTESPKSKTANTGAVGAAVTADSGGGGLSLLWAMAANIPIFGEATYGISEIVEDRHSALLTKPGDVRAMSHRMRQIVEDQQLAWSLRDMAHHEAYSFFSRRRYCDSMTKVYQQHVDGQTIAVPEMEETGGMRFAGYG